MTVTIRLAIVDDHPLFVEGVLAAIRSTTDIEAIGHGSTAEDAIRIVREFRPDVLLLDINMPGDSLATAQQLSQTQTSTKTVILSVSEDEGHVTRAMRAGASGYIVKGVSGSELARAVREIHLGARYVSPGLAARLLALQGASAANGQMADEGEQLTAREREVMAHVARGLTNKEVARVLSLSDKTVKYYMTRIMLKLQLRNRMEVVLWAKGERGIHAEA